MKNILKIEINENRIYGLDILRCLAILLVVIGHGDVFFSKSTRAFIYFLVFDGVSIFFVLSGFLIGGILIKEFEKKDFSFQTVVLFWKKRWFRTLPNYFLILTILIIFKLLYFNDFNFDYRYFIFSQNLFSPHPEWFPEAWSLSVEEWFYLLIPIVIICLKVVFDFNLKKATLYTSLIVITIITFFRFYKYLNIDISNVDEWDLNYRKLVFTRLDSLMYGVLGAYLAYYHKIIWVKFKKLLFFIGISLLLLDKFIIKASFDSLYLCVFSFTVNSVGTLSLMPYMSNLKKGQGVLYKIITCIALISYSMYLINFSLVREIIISNINFLGMNTYLNIFIKYFLYWFFTVLISILIYKYFELPILKFRDKKIS